MDFDLVDKKVSHMAAMTDAMMATLKETLTVALMENIPVVLMVVTMADE